MAANRFAAFAVFALVAIGLAFTRIAPARGQDTTPAASPVATGSSEAAAPSPAASARPEAAASPATGPGRLWTNLSFFLRIASGGADAEAYPAVSHLVSSGSDYLGFTDSHSTTSLNPTMVAAIYLGNGSPPTGVQAQLLKSFNINTSDSGSSTFSDRWGDYAGAWPSSSGFFDLASNLYLGGHETGYIAQITP